MGTDFYSVTIPATDDPISLEDTKNFLRIDSAVTEDDALIQALIKAVTIEGERFTNRCFVTRTFLGKFQQLELSKFDDFPYIQIRRAPIGSITSVKVMLNDVLTDVSSDDYDLKDSSGFARILFNDYGNIITDQVPYPLEVVFTAGYGNAAAVPDDIKTALKMHVLFLYENRGDVDTEGKVSIPREAKFIYQSYRILNTYG